MDEEIDRVLKVVLSRINASRQCDEAMKFTQAALNLSHARAIYAGIDEETKPKRGRPPKVAADEA